MYIFYMCLCVTQMIQSAEPLDIYVPQGDNFTINYCRTCGKLVIECLTETIRDEPHKHLYYIISWIFSFSITCKEKRWIIVSPWNIEVLSNTNKCKLEIKPTF